MTTRKLLYAFAITILFSCGSRERIITNDGKVYEVKGNTFYRNGEDVTNKLTKIEKEHIQSILEKHLEVEKAAKEKQDQIEESLEELKEREKELKEKQKQLDNKIEKREDAREDFFELRENLNDVKKEYEQLKEEGGLSSKDEKKWKKRLKDLELKLKQAELEINN